MILSDEEIQNLRDNIKDTHFSEALQAIRDLIETLEYTKYDYSCRIKTIQSLIHDHVLFGIDGVVKTASGESGFGYSDNCSRMEFEAYKDCRKNL